MDKSEGISSDASIDRVVIGNATLYRANCFDLFSRLPTVDAVVTDPPYGIGYQYRSYDDSPAKYNRFMAKLVPALVKVTRNGPCFVWQSQRRSGDWHRYFPNGYHIIAACKIYPSHLRKIPCYAWTQSSSGVAVPGYKMSCHSIGSPRTWANGTGLDRAIP
jgi:site-specific DNA-methyltransferase (adenine-specific)